MLPTSRSSLVMTARPVSRRWAPSHPTSWSSTSGSPGMDGWEVLDRIRRDETTKNIPVVVLTAHAEEESRRRANEGGADAFVTKPFQPNDFRTTVLSLLE